MRIGPDVAPFWTNWISRWLLRDRHGVATKNAVRNTLTRAFMHRRLWLNDPDCLMVRDGETALTLDEVQSLARCHRSDRRDVRASATAWTR